MKRAIINAKSIDGTQWISTPLINEDNTHAHPLQDGGLHVPNTAFS
jgi:hypothetical protein